MLLVKLFKFMKTFENTLLKISRFTLSRFSGNEEVHNWEVNIWMKFKRYFKNISFILKILTWNVFHSVLCTVPYIPVIILVITNVTSSSKRFNWQVFPLERHILFYLLTSGTAHCANMYPSSDDDTAELKEARTKINNLVGQWLKQDWI